MILQELFCAITLLTFIDKKFCYVRNACCDEILCETNRMVIDVLHEISAVYRQNHE